MLRGLKAKVFRVGRLVGRTTDGMFQKNPDTNAFYLLMKALGYLRMIPESMKQIPLEITPVDVCADAIMCLCERPGVAFHVVQKKPLPFCNAVSGIVDGLQTVNDSIFRLKLLEAAQENPETMAPLIEFMNGNKKQKSNVVLSAESTHNELEKAGFVWPESMGSELDAFRYHEMS